jgi:hypothetical protein
MKVILMKFRVDTCGRDVEMFDLSFVNVGNMFAGFEDCLVKFDGFFV